MKTAREKRTKFPPGLPPAEKLDKLILDCIGRGADRASSDAEFNRLALALFQHQFVLNTPYRRYCESLGRTPAGVAHWTQIPAVPTTAFKDAELTTLRPAQRTAVFHSSGTTEQRPSRHFHSRATLALYETALWTMFKARVAGDGWWMARSCRLVILTPTPAEAPHSSLVHMMETIRRRFGAPKTVFVGGVALEDGKALARAVQSSVGSRPSPVLLLGTALAFVRLLDAAKSLPLPPGSRVMETGGYKGRAREVPREVLHARLAATLSIPRSAIVSEYGMCELSSQFYTRPAPPDGRATIFTGPPWTRVRVLDPETGCAAREGEPGLIRVFDLANRASVLAIQTEDVGVRRGDGFELMGRAPQAEARGCSLMVSS
ncbi:MAG: long-chain fatty acid--CoA ligase [Verrucomicrobiae bacterium]|nr:long-chain fatty acid--CoA ligase [Verrucomicrobiae bacterium]